jgi:hypothetical protein
MEDGTWKFLLVDTHMIPQYVEEVQRECGGVTARVCQHGPSGFGANCTVNRQSPAEDVRREIPSPIKHFRSSTESIGFKELILLLSVSGFSAFHSFHFSFSRSFFCSSLASGQSFKMCPSRAQKKHNESTSTFVPCVDNFCCTPFLSFEFGAVPPFLSSRCSRLEFLLNPEAAPASTDDFVPLGAIAMPLSSLVLDTSRRRPRHTSISRNCGDLRHSLLPHSYFFFCPQAK